jgi:ABC-type polysaccharide/polyol phosphate export permease
MSTETPSGAGVGSSGAVADTGTHRRRAREDEFHTDTHVYEPHVVGLPPLRSYVREAWRRREFAVELARTKLRAQHFDTVFGKLWLIINPLLLAAVYFVLVDILRAGSRPADFFAHLVGGLFAYHLVADAMRDAVKSVTSGGWLILNSAFPRVLLPLASVVTAFRRFTPTILVYVVVHLVTGLPITWSMLWAVPIVAVLLVLASGLAMIVAATQVYFRDMASFLPYLLRLWLYVSPILYFADEVPERYRFLLSVNPLGQPLSAWSDALHGGRAPELSALLISCAWALGVFVVGFFLFVSREREFAVRL